MVSNLKQVKFAILIFFAAHSWENVINGQTRPTALVLVQSSIAACSPLSVVRLPACRLHTMLLVFSLTPNSRPPRDLNFLPPPMTTTTTPRTTTATTGQLLWDCVVHVSVGLHPPLATPPVCPFIPADEWQAATRDDATWNGP